MDVPDERDQQWFRTLYADYYPDLVRYGMRRLRDPEAAADLAQDVFMVTWRRRHQVPDQSLPWLYGVARRLLANQWRSRRTHPDPVPLTDPDSVRQHLGGDQPDAIADLAGVRSALVTLPEIDQEVLRLVGWEQLTVAEAAAALGCSRATARVRLHRARRRLTAALATTTGPQPTSGSTPESVPGSTPAGVPVSRRR